MSIIAFRADDELERKLRDSALKEKKTKTRIIQEALHQYLEGRPRRAGVQARTKRGGALEVLKDSIGIWDGPADASSDIGKKVGDYLLEKHRSRRV